MSIANLCTVIQGPTEACPDHHGPILRAPNGVEVEDQRADPFCRVTGKGGFYLCIERDTYHVPADSMEEVLRIACEWHASPCCTGCGQMEDEGHDLYEYLGEPTCAPCVQSWQFALHGRGESYVVNPPRWHERGRSA